MTYCKRFFALQSCVLLSSWAPRPVNSLKTLKNQLLTGEKNAEYTAVPERSFLTEEKNVRDRLLELIGEASIASFSRSTGVPESSLRSYLTRGIKPGMDHSVSIAEAMGVTVDWLATGRPPRLRAELVEAMKGVDKVRLQTAIAAVTEGVAKSGKLVAIDKQAELINAAYELAKEHSKDFIVRFITIAAM